jgi:hypothetical protein
MDDNDILHSLPLGECVEEDQIIQVVFDTAASGSNDDCIC